jgi:hypothetical protein
MSTNAIPVFDPTKLQRQTMGDPAHQIEVLALFVAETERLMRQVEDADDPQLRGDRLRALIALARNIGAARLAHEARAVETHIGDGSPDFAPLRAAVSDTLAFVRRTGV